MGINTSTLVSSIDDIRNNKNCIMNQVEDNTYGLEFIMIM